jgi:hypothetical protein
MVLGIGGGGDEGSHGMMGTVVYMAVFIILFSAFLSYASALVFEQAEEAGRPRPDGFQGAEYSMVRFFNTTNGEYLYAVTPSMYGTFINVPGATFDDNGLPASMMERRTDATNDLKFDVRNAQGDHITNIYVYPIKDYKGFGDAFVFFCHDGIWDAHSDAVYVSEVIENYREDDLRSVITISIGSSYTAYFTFPGLMSADWYLDDRSGFNISIGQSALDSAGDASSFWNVLTGLITYNLPGDGTGIWIMDVAICTAFNACCIFIIFWAITRVL